MTILTDLPQVASKSLRCVGWLRTLRQRSRLGARAICSTVEDVAHYVKTKQADNIVVMAGAGISTPSGIPDFRSPGTGLYDNLQKYKLPYPEAVFDIEYFHRDPKPFFTLAHELYPSGHYKPNVVHYFVQLLNDKGLLRRMYTQNIDGLERLAGLHEEKLVEAHGTFSKATCMSCRKEFHGKDIEKSILKEEVPKCPACNGVVKPNIVFFGEMLPSSFWMYTEDMMHCDLLIVMGTSLETPQAPSWKHKNRKPNQANVPTRKMTVSDAPKVTSYLKSQPKSAMQAKQQQLPSYWTSSVNGLHDQSQMQIFKRKMSTTTTGVSRGVLLGVGNPLLDMTISTDMSFLSQYNLRPNDAIIAGLKQKDLFSVMMRQNPMFGAGGATQNSIRVAQWLLEEKHATTFFGCVGDDERADILERKGAEAGVNIQYMRTKSKSTGVCGAIITDDNRSLVADLGAADFFEHAYIESKEKWRYVEQAQVFYIGGFMFPVCNQVIFDIGRHASEHDKIFTMNLSAPFLCKYFADKSIDIMPYIDILFGNESEAEEFCRIRGLPTSDLRTMALETSHLPKANPNLERLVVFTQGTQPTIIACNRQVFEFPIIPVSKEHIRDTNGCGDAFVGGFLSQLVQQKPLEQCVACGNYAANTVIKHWGCNFPSKSNFKV